jgi:hypothetical protein
MNSSLALAKHASSWGRPTPALLQRDLVQLQDHEIELTRMGGSFVRAIAMVFDRCLQADQNRARFSRIA